MDFRGKTPKKLGLDWSPDGDVAAISAKNIKHGQLVNMDKCHRGSVRLYKTWMKDGDLREGDLLLTSEAPLGEWYQVKAGDKFILSQRTFALRPNPKIVDADYFASVVSSRHFQDVLHNFATGTTVMGIRQKTLLTVPIELPDIETQRKIGQVISDLHAKVELNQQINKSLLKLATMVFDNWVENTKSETITSLDKIATYQNGIAMQKFPPIDDNAVLPVLKIRELNQDCVDNNSDLVTSGVKENVKVHDGDLIFSWSGTLIAKLWTGGDAALNQHLFKVTSTRYPRWFYYLWTLRHLREFQHIAADKKTTMGHIKRKDLTDAKVKIPSAEEFTQLDTILSPMIQQILNSGIESKQLTQLRNILLPKLLAGDIDLSKIETVMNNA